MASKFTSASQLADYADAKRHNDAKRAEVAEKLDRLIREQLPVTVIRQRVRVSAHRIKERARELGVRLQAANQWGGDA